MFPKVPWRVEADGLTVTDAEGGILAKATSSDVANWIRSLPAWIKLWSDEAEHRKRDYARRAVHRAIKTGKLKRLPCEVCGAERTEFHHFDYTKPFDGKFLCRRHHHEAEALGSHPSGQKTPLRRIAVD